MPVELKPFARIATLVLLGASLGLSGCQCFECETEDAGATKVSAEKSAAPMGDDPVPVPEAEVVWYDPTTWFVWLDGEKKPVRKGEPIPFEAYSTLGYQLQWSSFAAIQPEGRIEAVDFLDGVIVARDNRAAFTAISPRSGDIRWAKLQGYGLANFIGVVKSGENLLLVEEGQILPVSADQGVAVLNSAGRPIAQKLGRVVQTAPLDAGGMLLFGSESGHAVAHVPRAGVTSWQYLIGGRILARPTLLGSGGAAFVSTGGDVVVLSPEVGSAMGRAKVFGSIEAPAAAGVDR
ncbi:MAG: PQQ-like beta-propeller repeat protein, partial [Phycisphaerales bacterium]|nr:PQQ-like beta-propeller repeat protein [Phycisphaerales bacterium]